MTTPSKIQIRQFEILLDPNSPVLFGAGIVDHSFGLDALLHIADVTFPVFIGVDN
ncbi:hypothetical protein [Spirosoma pollinicola]|uniref:hypothetical protein n=1 Tax=Spirosoma pollinicola TaxID=2057025 RepID=UPI0012FDD6E8|nr:hypothetical protein [Spirosoma pollinicola]